MMFMATPFFMGLFDAIKEAPKYFWDVGIDFYNGCLSILLSVLKVEVADAGGASDSVQGVVSDAYVTVMKDGIYDNFLLLGGSLTICFFLIGYCRDSVDIRKIKNLEEHLFLFIRLFIAVAAVANIGHWMPDIISWSIDIITHFFDVDTVGITKTGSDFYDSIDNPIASVIFGFIFMVVMLVVGGGVLLIGFARLFKLLIYMALGPVMLSTIAGGGSLSHVAINWIKDFVSICFSNVVIVLATLVATSLVGINLMPDWEGSLAALLLIVEAVSVLGLIKISDTILGKIVGANGA